MSLSILNNVSSLVAQNGLSSTQASLQKTFTQLSTGMRINSGSDDAAGLSIANGMTANIAALTQSQQNANNGIGLLQTADGALSQVTTLLNRAVTLATEASNSGLSTEQGTALNTEFKSITDEIDQIGTATNFNGTAVFGTASKDNAVTVFMGDGDSAASVTTTIKFLQSGTSGATPTGLGIGGEDLTDSTKAATALTDVMNAIKKVAGQRGDLGAVVNQLNAAVSVDSNAVTNIQSAANGVQNADIAKTVANMTQYNVLQSTGMAALQQSNQAQQAVLKLVQ